MKYEFRIPSYLISAASSVISTLHTSAYTADVGISGGKTEPY